MDIGIGIGINNGIGDGIRGVALAEGRLLLRDGRHIEPRRQLHSACVAVFGERSRRIGTLEAVSVQC